MCNGISSDCPANPIRPSGFVSTTTALNHSARGLVADALRLQGRHSAEQQPVPAAAGLQYSLRLSMA